MGIYNGNVSHIPCAQCAVCNRRQQQQQQRPLQKQRLVFRGGKTVTTIPMYIFFGLTWLGAGLVTGSFVWSLMAPENQGVLNTEWWDTP